MALTVAVAVAAAVALTVAVAVAAAVALTVTVAVAAAAAVAVAVAVAVTLAACFPQFQHTSLYCRTSHFETCFSSPLINFLLLTLFSLQAGSVHPANLQKSSRIQVRRRWIHICLPPMDLCITMARVQSIQASLQA